MAEELSLFALEDEIEPEEIPVLQHRAFRVTGEEVLLEKLDPECWAKALAAGGSTHDAALSIYAKLRSEVLASEMNQKEEKAAALEERKLKFGAPKNVKREKVWCRRFSLVWDFLFWQMLLSLSGIGAFLGLLALSGSSWWPGAVPVLMLSIVLQVLPLVIHYVVRALCGNLDYHQSVATTAVLLIVVAGTFGGRILFGKPLPMWMTDSVQRIEGNLSTQVEATELSEQRYSDY